MEKPGRNSIHLPGCIGAFAENKLIFLKKLLDTIPLSVYKHACPMKYGDSLYGREG